MISVMVVPVLNRYDLLQSMLDSIDYPIRDLLIIDNGGELEKLRFPDFVLHSHVLPLPSNLGVAGSWNLGIKLFPNAEKWVFASNDVVFGAGALETLCEARRDEIALSGMFPYWQAFSLGEVAVRTLGLFDEGFTPAYFEDNDFQRRADHYGVQVRRDSEVKMSHANSSTIKSDPRLEAMNASTFASNRNYWEEKISRNDFGEGGWSLQRRRDNSWD